jgi:hypothetical protein
MLQLSGPQEAICMWSGQVPIGVLGVGMGSKYTKVGGSGGMLPQDNLYPRILLLMASEASFN